MVGVGKAVPDRNPGVFRQLLHIFLGIAPVFNSVKEPAQHLGGVLQRLLLSHLGAACVQIGDVGALLGGRHLKRTPCAGGGLFKEQHNVLAFQGRIADPGPALGL